MPSLSPKHRLSLCLFSYEDGRRCRTPRIASHPHFCFYHAQKESRVEAAQTLAKDLDYFFSGDYLSANDLSTALSRLIPAAVRGDIKPRLARTVAYMFQTLIQSIHLSQREYANAFGTEGWRKSIRNSVSANQNYLFPPDPQPAPPKPAQTQAPAPPPPSAPPPSQPAAAPPSQPRTSPPLASAPQPPTSSPAARPLPSNNSTPPMPPRPRTQPGAPNRDPYAVHFDHNYHLAIDGKPW